MRDAAPFVRQAVRSVLEQEFEDLELVVVDDGSTDGSADIVEEVSDSRVRVVPGPERGVAAAFNAGVGAARGEVIMRCDADDFYTPGRVRALVEALDARPECGAVCAQFSTVDRSGRTVAHLRTGEVGEEITGELLAGETRTHFNTFAVRVEHMRALGGAREYFESAEDIDLQLRLAGVCRVWYEPVLVHCYRLHDDSITHTVAAVRRKFFDDLARAMSRERESPLGETHRLPRAGPRSRGCSSGKRGGSTSGGTSPRRCGSGSALCRGLRRAFAPGAASRLCSSSAPVALQTAAEWSRSTRPDRRLPRRSQPTPSSLSRA
jgi:glycosyltransferase involved in cell wall biosynthesis